MPNITTQVSFVANTVIKSADVNTNFTNISAVVNGSLDNSNISASAAIARSKLATGTASHVVINDGTGAFSSEAQLAKSRGGTGADNSSVTFPSSGTVQAITPNEHGVLVSGSAATATVLAPDSSTTKVLVSGGASADPAWGTVDLTAAVSGALPNANGGTGFSTYATGDTIYASASNTLSKLTIGSANQVLRVINGIPGWGASPSGNINYISANPDAEVDTTGWATYADAAANTPVDGTGGSPSSTWTRTTSSPLRSGASFLWTKAGSANRQGEGVSYAFSIDNADQAKPLAITFDYLVASGTFTASNGVTAPLNDGTTTTNAGNSDLEVFIYDVTNSVLIPVAPQVLTSNSSVNSFQFKGVFQSASNSTSYRLIIHTATTTTNNFTVKFDNFFVGPQSVSYGAPATDWVAYTPTFTGFGTPTGVNFISRRVGDTLEIDGTFTTGTCTGTEAQITLGFNGINGNVTSSSALPTLSIAGECIGAGAASSTYFGNIQVLKEASKGYITFSLHTSTANGFSKGTGSGVFSNSTTYTFVAKVPIAGWSSTVLMSNDTDTRVVAALYTGRATGTFNSSFNITTFPTKVVDTHAAYSSGTYTVPVSGYYDISAYVSAAHASVVAGDYVGMGIFVNGVEKYSNYTFAGSTSNIALNPTNSVKSVPLVAGDLVTIGCLSSGTTPSYANNPTQDVFSIARVSGPSAIAATETVAASATGNPASATSGNPIIVPTVSFDTHGAYNSSTGRFTCPISGIYRVSGALASASSATTLTIYKNASTGPLAGNLDSNGEATFTGLVKCVAGDILDIRPGGTVDATDMALHFERLGN